MSRWGRTLLLPKISCGHVTNDLKRYARRVLVYLFDTKDLKLQYKAADSMIFRSFCDASFAPHAHSDDEYIPENIWSFEEPYSDCYSVSGHLLFHFGNLVAWGTSKQKVIATSTTAAEIIAVCDNLDTMLQPSDLLF